MDILIKDLMTNTQLSSGPQAALLTVVQALRDQQLSCAVVVDNDVPIGIVTERDLTRALAQVLESGDATAVASVGDIMSRPPVTVREDLTLFEALVIAGSRKIRHLPVVNDAGALIGMVTHSDLAQAHFQVLERSAELVEANAALRALSMTDALLGIGNRRSMEVDLDHTLSAAVRYQRPCALAVLDVDYFKRYNDHYGHQAGDTALQQVADHIQHTIRSADRLYRYGGEELLLLMPETEHDTATQMVDRLVHSLAGQQIPHLGSPLGKLTISAGVAALGAPFDTPVGRDELIRRADAQLYMAKANGRNQARAA